MRSDLRNEPFILYDKDDKDLPPFSKENHISFLSSYDEYILIILLDGYDDAVFVNVVSMSISFLAIERLFDVNNVFPFLDICLTAHSVLFDLLYASHTIPHPPLYISVNVSYIMYVCVLLS